MESAEKGFFIFRFDTLAPAFVVPRIQSTLEVLGTPSPELKSFGRPFRNLGELLVKLQQMNRTTFNVVGQEYEFDCGKVRNKDLDFLLVGFRGKRNFVWDQWAAPFIGSRNFVMGYVVDSQYDFWQNAYDPIQYEARHRPFNHLPMKSNGLPYPLEKMIIDTSQNPGRRTLRNGYHEAVASVMWLGETFWHLTGADRKEIERSGWLQVAHPLAEVIRIQAAEEYFRTPDSASGEIQKKLRSVLFPRLVTV